MAEIGRVLKDTRERLGLTLEEVERATHIRVRYLESIEEDEFEALPSQVQVRGFLRNYADFLGLDSGEILLQYADILQSRRPKTFQNEGASQAKKRQPKKVHVKKLRWLSTDLLIAVGIALLIISVLIWGGGRILSTLHERDQQPEEMSALITLSPMPAVSPTVELTSAPPEASLTEPSATPTLPLPFDITSGVDVTLVAEKRAWVRIVVDDVELFKGRVHPGDVLEYRGENTIEVITGNGGALHVYFNGKDQGLMGGLDQVIIRLWTLNGVITPTPTQTRTATVTPTSGPEHTETPAPTVTR